MAHRPVVTVAELIELVSAWRRTARDADPVSARAWRSCAVDVEDLIGEDD